MERRVLEPTYDVAHSFPSHLLQQRLSEMEGSAKKLRECDANGWPVTLAFRDHEWGDNIEQERQVCMTKSPCVNE